MIVVFGGLVLLHVTRICCQKMSIKEFCNVKCLRPTDIHTICKFKCKEDEARCKDFNFYPLSNDERQILLDQHNMYRNKVASGEDRRGGNEPAKNMKVLNYDVDMEVTTYCWGKRCIFAHDECRYIPKYTSAGQNLFLQSGTAPIDGNNNKLLNKSVTGWYEEIKDTTKALIEHFGQAQAMIGHFTQVVWGSTQFIACSRVTWTDDSEPSYKYKYHLICNYSPAGNFLQSPVYEFGEGCSPPDEPNEKYKALCGKTLPIADKDTLQAVETEDVTQASNIPYNVNTSPIRFNGVMTFSLIYLITSILR